MQHVPSYNHTLWKITLHTTTCANNTTFTPCVLCGKAWDQLWHSLESLCCLARELRDSQLQPLPAIPAVTAQMDPIQHKKYIRIKQAYRR
ncbi:hypothetical protein SK128_014004, partial [Halocaridina rubra]